MITAEERSRAASAALVHALSDLFAPERVLGAFATDRNEFEAGHDEIVTVLARLTYVDDLYLPQENFDWAARCLFHTTQARNTLQEAGLLSSNRGVSAANRAPGAYNARPCRTRPEI